MNCPYLKSITYECTYTRYNQRLKKLPICKYKNYKKCPLLLESKLNGGKNNG